MDDSKINDIFKIIDKNPTDKLVLLNFKIVLVNYMDYQKHIFIQYLKK